MLLVTVLVGTHHAEVKVELDGLPCLFLVDVMNDLVSSDCLCCHILQSLFGWLEIIRYLLCGLLRLDELYLGEGMDGVDDDTPGEDSTPLQDTLLIHAVIDTAHLIECLESFFKAVGDQCLIGLGPCYQLFCCSTTFHNPVSLFRFFTSESKVGIDAFFPTVDIKFRCNFGTVGLFRMTVPTISFLFLLVRPFLNQPCLQAAQ